MGERARGGDIPTIIAVYALWLLTGAIAFAVCITWQTTLQRLYVALGLNKYGLAAFTYTVLIVLILGWLTLVIVAEGYYRRAAEAGRLWRRGAGLIGALVALAAVGIAVGWMV